MRASHPVAKMIIKALWTLKTEEEKEFELLRILAHAATDEEKKAARQAIVFNMKRRENGRRKENRRGTKSFMVSEKGSERSGMVEARPMGDEFF